MYCRTALCFLLLLAGCKEAKKTTRPRVAVLRFENLGDPDSDWIGRALSELLKRRFRADDMPRARAVAPGISSERLLAIHSGANRLITGYYTNLNGALRVTVGTEDTATGKQSDPVTVNGSLGSVVAEVAKRFGAPEDSSSLNATSPALRDYANASDTSGSAAAVSYEVAIEKDPKFGPAYLGLLRTDPRDAEQTMAKASAQAATFSKEDRAYLRLEGANFHRDPKERAAALSELAALDGNSVQALRTLADLEMSARNPAEAAKHYREAIAITPNDANLRNLLTYAALYTGNESEARTAAADYKRLAPNDPNTLDTQGDVELAFGHFAEAERDYAATPWKAANARLQSGDLAGASAIMARHIEDLRKGANPTAGYREAEMLYLTGRQSDGITAMARFADSATQPELKSVAYTQATIWAVIAHSNAQAARLGDQALRLKGQNTFLIAAVARFLAQPPASTAEWQQRASTTFGGNGAATVRHLAVGLALLLAGRFTDAVPDLEQVYRLTPASDSTPMYLYGWALLETGRKAEAAQLLRLNPIPNAGIAPSFEALYTPHVTEWRKASLRQ